MAIVRVTKKDHPYVQIDKRIFEDVRLSWRAKGILGYLLSKPDGWKISIKDIWNKGKEGRNAVQDCMAELAAAGYAELIVVHSETGEFSGKEWVIYDEPKTGFSVVTEKPKMDAPKNRKTGFRSISNNELNSNNEERESENKNLALLDTPAPAPVVEKSEPVEAKKEKAPPIPAAPPEAPPGPGESETGDRSQILGLRDRPKAETPAQLREAMQKFYADYPNEWTYGIMELSKGQKYAKEKRAEIVTDWCCHQVEHNQQNNTYQMLNASLQKWFRNQERAESWKGLNSGSAPGNSDNLRYQAPKPNEITPAYVP